jgi:clan AA aspartic protease (TIGR02281 family)
MSGPRKVRSVSERTYPNGLRRAIGMMPAVLSLLIAVWAAAGSPDAEVLAPGVVVRKTPAPTAPIVTEFQGGTQVEVLFTQQGPGGNWAQISLPSGSTGFVPEQALRHLTAPPQWRAIGPGSGASSVTRPAAEGVLDVPLRRAGGVFLVKARINDQVTTHFVVDTGAATVTISHALADELGLDYENNPKQRLVTPSGIMMTPRIVLGSIYVPDQGGAGVTGVEAVIATIPEFPPGIAGLLGQSFLRHFHVTIEAERGVMHLQPLRK